MTEETRDDEQKQDTGAAIDTSELQSIAAELEAEEKQETAGELEEQAEGPSTSEVIYPLISFGCDLGCPNWMVQAGEKKALADGYADMIDKYWPGGIGAFGVELNALLMTAAIFGPRVAKGIPAREPKEKEATEGETATNEG